MTVYVDDMYKYPMGRFRGMRMSHLIADTEPELHAMAKRIGVARRWHQGGDHYDIALSKRRLAIEQGAIPITLRQCAIMVANRRGGWPMGGPDGCVAISQQRRALELLAKELIG